MTGLRSSMAAGVDWKAAIILLMVAILFRDQMFSFATWMDRDSAPVATIRPAAPTEPHPKVQPPEVFTTASAPVSHSVEPHAQAAPMPVVITPTLEYSRNIATARRERDGHFSFATNVNGVSMPMVFDTGASYVTLRSTDAARVGIDTGTLDYSAIGKTANGAAEFALVTIPTLTVGTITRHNVAAMVARPGMLEVNLLGQSFLIRVASVTIQGNELTIRGGDMRQDR